MTDQPEDGKKPCCGDLSIEDCHKALEQLEEYLDRDITLDDRVVIEEHLHLCDRCTEEYNLRSRAQEILRAKLCADKCPDKLRASISALIHEECEGC
jgi:mycothiol system anti-sigma-R factor